MPIRHGRGTYFVYVCLLAGNALWTAALIQQQQCVYIYVDKT